MEFAINHNYILMLEELQGPLPSSLLEDSDEDGMPDIDDLSPNCALELDRNKIQNFVIPTNISNNTQLLFQIARPQKDYYNITHANGNLTPLLWNGNSYVEIVPVIRQFSEITTEVHTNDLHLTNGKGIEWYKKAPFIWPQKYHSRESMATQYGKGFETFNLHPFYPVHSNTGSGFDIDWNNDGVPDNSIWDTKPVWFSPINWFYSEAWLADDSLEIDKLFDDHISKISRREMQILSSNSDCK